MYTSIFLRRVSKSAHTFVVTILILINLIMPKSMAIAAPTQLVQANTANLPTMVGTITRLGFLPRALALDETRNRLFIFDQSTKSIFIYDATTLQELGSVVTTLDDCLSMVIDESHGKLYAGFFGPGAIEVNNIVVIDIVSGTLLKYLPSAGYNYLVVDQTLDVVYVSHSPYSYWGGTQWLFKSLERIDVATDIMTEIMGISSNVYTSMAVNPVTHELFVANWSQNNNNLFIVNPATLAVEAVPNMNGFGVAVNWIENKAYITYCASAGFEGVCIYNRTSGAISRMYTFNDSTQPLVFNPNVNRLYSNTEVNPVTTIINGTTDTFTNIAMPSTLPTVGVRYSTDNVYLIGPTGTYVMKGATGEILTTFSTIGTCTICTSAVVMNQASGRVFVINESTYGAVNVIQENGSATHMISGNAGVAGVIMTYTDGTPKFINADGSGNYSIIVPSGWSGTVVPYKKGYRFTPASRAYSNTQSDQANQNYTAEICEVCIFSDVPYNYWAVSYIERLYNAGITGGCSISPLNYCPETEVTRAQMSVFLLRGIHGSSYSPPVVGGSTGFGDVPTNYWAAAWIKQLAAEGITGGCGSGNYCPEVTVTRSQMAVFLLRAEHGSAYSPPVATGVFTDVPVGYWADRWIEQLAAEAITGGCGTDIYCPETPVTRAQMAVFLVRTFNLP